MDRTLVRSSNIRSVGYDPASRTLMSLAELVNAGARRVGPTGAPCGKPCRRAKRRAGRARDRGLAALAPPPPGGWVVLGPPERASAYRRAIWSAPGAPTLWARAPRGQGIPRDSLEVEFHSGGVYQYSGVSETVFQAFMRAASKGSYFHDHIKDRYPNRQAK